MLAHAAHLERPLLALSGAFAASGTRLEGGRGAGCGGRRLCWAHHRPGAEITVTARRTVPMQSTPKQNLHPNS